VGYVTTYPLQPLTTEIRLNDPECIPDTKALYIDTWAFFDPANTPEMMSPFWKILVTQAKGEGYNTLAAHFTQEPSQRFQKLGMIYIRTVDNWNNTNISYDHLQYNLNPEKEKPVRLKPRSPQRAPAYAGT